VLGRYDRRAALRRVPLFAACSRREIARIADIAGEEEFAPGQELTREGETGRAFYVVLQGEAEVLQGGERIQTRGGGDFFGEIALLAHSPRNATIRAMTPLRVLVLPDRKFRALLGRQPDLQESVIEALAQRL
jgi:CRP-like cAMP-binding protein